MRLKVEAADGSIAHSELVFGEGVIMAGGKKQDYRQSPRAIDGANTQSMMVYVDDVEAHFNRAREAGAKILSEPTIRFERVQQSLVWLRKPRISGKKRNGDLAKQKSDPDVQSHEPISTLAVFIRGLHASL